MNKLKLPNYYHCLAYHNLIKRSKLAHYINHEGLYHFKNKNCSGFHLSLIVIPIQDISHNKNQILSWIKSYIYAVVDQNYFKEQVKVSHEKRNLQKYIKSGYSTETYKIGVSTREGKDSIYSIIKL